jgi:hypothetical protein
MVDLDGRYFRVAEEIPRSPVGSLQGCTVFCVSPVPCRIAPLQGWNLKKPFAAVVRLLCRSPGDTGRQFGADRNRRPLRAPYRLLRRTLCRAPSPSERLWCGCEWSTPAAARLNLPGNCWRRDASGQRAVFQPHSRRRRTDATFLACDRALFGNAHHLRELGVDPLVFPPLVKEILQGRTILAPGFERQLGDLAELPVVVGQFALAPVMHHQQEISPVLHRGEVTGVADIIADRFIGCDFLRQAASLFRREQSNQLSPADRTAGRLPDQRAQMRDTMTAWQPSHPENHHRHRRVHDCCSWHWLRFAFHVASTSPRATVPAVRFNGRPGPRVR